MAIRIGLGLTDFPFSDAAAFWRWVHLCEDGGIDSLWQSDTSVAPIPYLECMSVMAALAGATRRMRFGMNVLSLGFREPLILARQCATIDYLSNGRLLPAFGIGNLNSVEWGAMGIATTGQGGRTNEALHIIAALWRGESVTFEGKYFRYKDATILPLPIQRPLPLWLGGSSDAAIERTGYFGTGWQAGLESPEEVAPIIESIKRVCAKAGREIDSEHFGAGFFYRIGGRDEEIARRRFAFYQKLLPGRDANKFFIVGSAEQLIGRVREYVAAGVSKFILRPVGEGDEDIAEQTRLLMKEVLPEIHG
jgi:probable F420-dependent oxidoreductase